MRKGEVVGIAGLMGAGRTEFASGARLRQGLRARTSAARSSSRAEKVDVSTIGRAIDNGIAYVTEDRKTYGLNLIDHIKHNATIANLAGVSAERRARRHGRAEGGE